VAGPGTNRSPASRQWKVFICDLNGRKIEDITSVTRDKKYSEVLNTPSQFSFTADTANEKLSQLHSDGRPVLDSLCRVVKAYRSEYNESTLEDEFVLRFAGRVWSLEDVGDDNTYSAAVVCYDALHMLSKRVCLNSVGSPFSVSFSGGGTSTLTTLIDRTNTYAGHCGLGTGGTINTSPSQTVDWSLKKVSEAVSELTSADVGFDISITPLDTETGILGNLNCYYPARGSRQDGALLGWRALPHNLLSVNRVFDPELAANVIWGVGTATVGDDQVTTNFVDDDESSFSTFGQLEEIVEYQDVNNITYLETLVGADLIARRPPTETLAFVPTPTSNSPEPWSDFVTGDSITVRIGSDLRGGLRRYQRIFGFGLDISNDTSIETMTFVLTESGA